MLWACTCKLLKKYINYCTQCSKTRVTGTTHICVINGNLICCTSSKTQQKECNSGRIFLLDHLVGGTLAYVSICRILESTMRIVGHFAARLLHTFVCACPCHTRKFCVNRYVCGIALQCHEFMSMSKDAICFCFVGPA